MEYVSPVAEFCSTHLFCKPFISGVLASLISSYCFIFATLRIYRPRISLSKNISEFKNRKGVPVFYFKMVNHSIHNAFDVKVEPNLKIPEPGVNGKENQLLRKVELIRSEYPVIDRYYYKFQKKHDLFTYALWLGCKEDIRDLMGEHTYAKLELKVTCKHGLTGLGKVTSQEYSSIDIIKGKFECGKSMKIITT